MVTDMKFILNQLIDGKDLETNLAEQAMELIMSGNATQAQIGAFLVLLRQKGENFEEIAAFAKIMRQHCSRINPKYDKVLVDTCGTGGDKIKTFNISTLAAFIVAGSGIKVAKHGNRSVTSKCGSADLLEGFGVNINADPKIVEKCIENGIGFMFAPKFHPAMKYAIGPRREIGLRTVFNILGPLTNPANANSQLLGVFDPNITEKMANALKSLGTNSAYIVHGDPGLDEISTLGKTKISELNNDIVKTYFISPKDFSIPMAKPKDIQGGLLDENLEIAIKILNGESSKKTDIVLLNSAVGIVVGQKAGTINEGLEVAKESVSSGNAYKKLKELIKNSGGSLEKMEEQFL
ncbi:MAG: anthranilate phosphoribosyltransferase [Candidatus Helarchaeota archaeon]|nr:anthranilate phosphoribosyltransferase [Candidatus Helarchaeota archaeon]